MVAFIRSDSTARKASLTGPARAASRSLSPSHVSARTSQPAPTHAKPGYHRPSGRSTSHSAGAAVRSRGVLEARLGLRADAGHVRFLVRRAPADRPHAPGTGESDRRTDT